MTECAPGPGRTSSVPMHGQQDYGSINRSDGRLSNAKPRSVTVLNLRQEPDSIRATLK